MPTAVEYRQEAGQWITEARGIIELAEKEKREMSAEETVRFDKLHDDAEAKIAKAKRTERQALADAGFKTAGKTKRDEDLGERHDFFTDLTPIRGAEKIEYSLTDYKQRSRYRMGIEVTDTDRAFVRHLARGLSALTVEERGLLEKRATLQADSDIGGGYFAASERFINVLLKEVDDILIIRQLATVIPCGRNESLGAPKLDGDISAFEFGAGELTEAAEDTGIAFGKRELKPRDLKRKIVTISKRLLESAYIDVEGIVTARIAYALAKGEGAAFMTGDGAARPLGLFMASDDGIGTARDVATGNATGFTADGLIDAQGALKSGYQGNARWLFHQDAMPLIRKLKDGNGQYIWVPGLQASSANIVLGRPYFVADGVPNTYTNGLYCGMYADFSFYWIADAIHMTIQRLVEKYALTGQIGLLCDNMAVDGAPMKAEAFVRMKCAA